MGFDRVPRPSTNRSAPSSSAKMSSPYDRYDSYSSPQTPPSQSARYRLQQPGLTVRPPPRETFLEDITPVDSGRGQESGDELDPHDLSLSPKHVTRTSVVDNMLLSLDQFAISGSPLFADSYFFGSPDSDRHYLGSRRYSIRRERQRGHTYSSSLSSEVDFHPEETGGCYSSQSPPRHRSNNLPPSFNVRSRDGMSIRGRVYDSQRVPGPREGSQESHPPFARQGSKGSGSSVDLSQTMAARRTSYGARRSASFDYGSRSILLSENVTSHDPLPDDIDAAPTPTVPAGPRRGYTTPLLTEHSGVPRYPPPRTPALSRKNSNRSARSALTSKARAETLGTATIKSRENDYKAFRELPPSHPPPPPPTQHQHQHQQHPQPPYAVNPSAPSPTISFNKPPVPMADPPPSSRERPGFFRRVFGSSKPSSPGLSDAHPGEHQADLSQAQEGDATTRGKKPTTKSHGVANSHLNQEVPSPSVAKKPSFFRRRKKSIAEHVPPLSFSGVRHPDPMKVESSPVSSLRIVMNPFLADPVSPQYYDSKEYPDHTMSSRRMATVENELSAFSRSLADEPSSSQEYSTRVVQEPARDGSAVQNDSKFGLYLNIPSGPDSSFLADSSSNEGMSHQPNQKAGSSRDKSRRPKTSPDAAGQHPPNASDGYQSPTDHKLPDSAPPTSQGSEKAMKLAENQAGGATVTGRSSKDRLSLRPRVMRDGKGRFELGSTEEQLDLSRLSLQIEDGAESPRGSNSDMSHYHTASNTPLTEAPLTPRDEPRSPLNAAGAEATGLDPSLEACRTEDEPTTVDREQARRIFNSQEEVVGHEPAAAWLGGLGRAMIRSVYMELFNWMNMDILAALRILCTKITLKGETQQVDRVLDAFSTRWCECNPNHGFKAVDVVHTICYSLLLLNTDLHLADIDQKMTRNQFIRNTMPTIHRVASDAAPNGFETIRASSRLQNHASTPEFARPSLRSLPFYSRDHSHSSEERDALSKASQPPEKISQDDGGGGKATVPDFDQPPGGAGPLISTPFNGTIKAWEALIETVLKDFYNSIQKQRLPLYGSQVDGEGTQQLNGIGLLRRTPSTLSKCGSDIFPRGRSSDIRFATSRWTSKPRSRARLYPSSNIGSSRTSLDDQSSVWSPSASSTWSKYSLGKTQTSMSVDSFSSEYPRGDYQQAIGFANALSHAIIREDSAHSVASFEEATPSTAFLEDESLELAGAPWAKEGSLKHKHHLDSVEKRAKDRNWNECFAVIQRGWMRLFSFNASTRSMRLKAKQRQNTSLVVGGGNWMENAEEVWKFLLRQTIASALPSPGYSKSRPHVWALSLPNGAVHLFQVGTAEIVKEFVSTANYWSARLSKEPLMGGISNMEHGWSDAVINGALIYADSRSPPSSSGAPRPSIQSSIRSSFDQQNVRAKLPADRLHISDWTPPQQTMMASNLAEMGQLKALQNYVKNVEEELQKHNELRPAMVLAFSPKHPNSCKAMTNWERKSSYLLREIVKFRTYIDCLQAAQGQKEKIYASRQEDDNDRPSEDCANGAVDAPSLTS
ncbi:hypothetical protein V8E54_003369 [Elaphomyces granulatus]